MANPRMVSKREIEGKRIVDFRCETVQDPEYGAVHFNVEMILDDGSRLYFVPGESSLNEYSLFIGRTGGKKKHGTHTR